MDHTGEERYIANYRKTLEDTANWLDREFSKPGVPPQASKLSLSLGEYVAHCLRQLEAGNMSHKSIERKRRKVQEAYFKLWEIARSRNIE